MANAKIKISDRDETKNPRQIRAQGFIPGSIYGKDVEAKNIQLNAHEFELLYKANKNETWELKLDKTAYKAKIQELQMNNSTGEFLNIEFAVV